MQYNKQDVCLLYKVIMLPTHEGVLFITFLFLSGIVFLFISHFAQEGCKILNRICEFAMVSLLPTHEEGSFFLSFFFCSVSHFAEELIITAKMNKRVCYYMDGCIVHIRKV